MNGAAEFLPSASATPRPGVLATEAFRRAIKAVPPGERHPAIVLDRTFDWTPVDARDKSLDEPSQAKQRRHLKDVACLSGRPDLAAALADASARRRHALQAGGATEPLKATTAWRLTLHLGRPGVLENAGIALHPLYGFPYLPGEGVKGLTRAYAETVGNGGAGAIEEVLGSTSRAGAVVFFDAWPIALPRLAVDIVNNHHVDYYGANAATGHDRPPPGDWDDPNPVYFLAIEGGTTFSFALAKRHAGVPDEQLRLARRWLEGALRDLGAGAKTAAGYGYFVPGARPPAAGALPKPQGRVTAVLLEEKTKKGGWRAKDEASGLSGPIQNTGDVPADRKPGEGVELVVASVNEREIAFRWPGPKEKKP